MSHSTNGGTSKEELPKKIRIQMGDRKGTLEKRDV
jgi:hypothetical protein